MNRKAELRAILQGYRLPEKGRKPLDNEYIMAAYGYLLKRGETCTASEFAEKIKGIYSMENLRNRAVVNHLNDQADRVTFHRRLY